MFVHRSLASQGTVLRLRSKPNSDNDATVYAPVFTFNAIDGQSYTVASNNYSDPPEFSAGQSVKVLYERASPQEARIDSLWQVWAMEIVLGAIGGIAPGKTILFLAA